MNADDMTYVYLIRRIDPSQHQKSIDLSLDSSLLNAHRET